MSVPCSCGDSRDTWQPRPSRMLTPDQEVQRGVHSRAYSHKHSLPQDRNPTMRQPPPTRSAPVPSTPGQSCAAPPCPSQGRTACPTHPARLWGHRGPPGPGRAHAAGPGGAPAVPQCPFRRSRGADRGGIERGAGPWHRTGHCGPGGSASHPGGRRPRPDPPQPQRPQPRAWPAGGVSRSPIPEPSPRTAAFGTPPPRTAPGQPSHHTPQPPRPRPRRPSAPRSPRRRPSAAAASPAADSHRLQLPAVPALRYGSRQRPKQRGARRAAARTTAPSSPRAPRPLSLRGVAGVKRAVRPAGSGAR